MSTNPTPNRPTDLPPPTPPSAPGGMALKVPTAAPCAECGTTGGWIKRTCRRPMRARGLCKNCYDRHDHAGTLDMFSLKPPASDTFEGLPDDFVPPPTGWPIAPALTLPDRQPPPWLPDRWKNAVTLSRTEQNWLVNHRSYATIIDHQEAA